MLDIDDLVNIYFKKGGILMENKVKLIMGRVINTNINDDTNIILRGKMTSVNAVRQYHDEPNKKVRIFVFSDENNDPNSVRLSVETDFLMKGTADDRMRMASYVTCLPYLWEAIVVNVPNYAITGYIIEDYGIGTRSDIAHIVAFKMPKKQAMDIFDAFLPGYEKVRDELFDLENL